MEAAEIEKELAELETKAEHLRALYEQYFMGHERMEPLVMRRDVDRRVRLLRREQLRNTAQRFKFNTLVQRFNTMQQYWARVVREIENGTYRRDVIRAAARFGEGALTALGTKKTKTLLAAVAVEKAKLSRTIEETLELQDDDLIEDEDLIEEEEQPAPPAPARAAAPALPGVPGDVPIVRMPLGLGRPAALPPVAAPSPAVPAPAPPALRGIASARTGADPVSIIRPAPVDVKQRVSALAADLRGPPKAERTAPSFGQLDIDLDDTPSAGRATPVPAVPAARVAVPKPTGSAPGGAKPMGPLPAPTPPAARPAAAPQARPGGFGELDIALDPLGPTPTAPVPAPRPAVTPPAQRSPAAALPRTAPVVPAVAAPRAPAPAPAAVVRPPPAASDEGDLSDGRIRQIYAKYVETKRAAQESTAGVTYEKLATSLRAQASKLKSTHPNRSIDYEVVVKDGKTHLKPVLR
jgi:hypothetical protein